jgi:hypothetical protein
MTKYSREQSELGEFSEEARNDNEPEETDTENEPADPAPDVEVPEETAPPEPTS